MGLVKGRMLLLEDGRLVSELVRRESRRMLSLHGKGVLVRKVMVCAEGMRIEPMELSGGYRLSSMQSPL